MDPATGDPQDKAHRGIVHRILRWQIALAVLGLPAWWLTRDFHHALSFATGAGAAIGSFWMLEKFTRALGGKPESGVSLAFSALRILLIGGALFGIIRSYSLLKVPLATGIMVTVVAITIEGFRQSFYARTLDN
jgi:hypothetical protein